MLSCRQATELMSQAQDRPLTIRERVALAMHKAICEGCRNVSAHLRYMRDISRAWRQNLLPSDPDSPSPPKDR